MLNPAQYSLVRLVNGDLWQVQLRVVEKQLARVQAHLAWIVFLFIFDGLDELGLHDFNLFGRLQFAAVGLTQYVCHHFTAWLGSEPSVFVPIF